MSKRGRGRRTPEQRIEAKDVRSTIAYLQRLQRAMDKESKGWAKSAVSETTESEEKK